MFWSAPPTFPPNFSASNYISNLKFSIKSFISTAQPEVKYQMWKLIFELMAVTKLSLISQKLITTIIPDF